MRNTKHIHYCGNFIQDTVYQILSQSAEFYDENISALFLGHDIGISQNMASKFHEVV